MSGFRILVRFATQSSPTSSNASLKPSIGSPITLELPQANAKKHTTFLFDFLRTGFRTTAHRDGPDRAIVLFHSAQVRILDFSQTSRCSNWSFRRIRDQVLADCIVKV